MINKIKTIIKDMSFFLFYVMRIFPIKQNKIVFSNFLGKGYGDNPKYICEALLKSNEILDIVWLVNKNNIDKIPKTVRAVNIKSLRAYYELATAHIWIDNCRKSYSVRKRKNQFYIQTWHSGIGPKRIEKDAIDILPAHYIKEAMHDSSMIDLLLAGSVWEETNFKKCFWYDGRILMKGLPRQDIYWSDYNSLKNNIKNNLGIRESNIFLYAPTFKRSESENFKVVDIDWNKILSALSHKFGGNWIGALRLHPNIAYISDKISLPDNVINLSYYDDPQELVLISDFVVSDYSSIIFESAMISIPSFIFSESMMEKGREITFSLSELPFPYADSFDKLITEINNFDEELFINRCNEFFFDKCGVIKNPFSSYDVSNLICSICKNNI